MATRPGVIGRSEEERVDPYSDHRKRRPDLTSTCAPTSNLTLPHCRVHADADSHRPALPNACGGRPADAERDVCLRPAGERARHTTRGVVIRRPSGERARFPVLSSRFPVPGSQFPVPGQCATAYACILHVLGASMSCQAAVRHPARRSSVGLKARRALPRPRWCVRMLRASPASAGLRALSAGVHVRAGVARLDACACGGTNLVVPPDAEPAGWANDGRCRARTLGDAHAERGRPALVTSTRARCPRSEEKCEPMPSHVS